MSDYKTIFKQVLVNCRHFTRDANYRPLGRAWKKAGVKIQKCFFCELYVHVECWKEGRLWLWFAMRKSTRLQSPRVGAGECVRSFGGNPAPFPLRRRRCAWKLLDFPLNIIYEHPGQHKLELETVKQGQIKVTCSFSFDS